MEVSLLVDPVSAPEVNFGDVLTAENLSYPSTLLTGEGMTIRQQYWADYQRLRKARDLNKPVSRLCHDMVLHLIVFTFRAWS